MGYKYTDIIQFNDVKDTGTGFGAATLGVKNNFNYNADETQITSINKKVLNAVEIDWNGAQVAGKTLNTTGEVLSLISDNNTNIETLKQHSHANYATKSYVTEEINKASISGGSGLDVEDYPSTDTVNYNLLVAPEGSKYTEIGSLNNGSDWRSNLWAGFDPDGFVTLYSDNFNGKFVGELTGKFEHKHANYATQSYVTQKINEASISGGSGLNVEDYTDTTLNYNLLVAPEGSKYTELGSLGDGWSSKLYATVDNNNHGDTTLYSTYFDGTFIGKFAHSHADYATTGHSHGNYTTSIEILEDQITYLTSRINDLEELVGGGSSTDPDNPDFTPTLYFYVGETRPTVDNYTTLCTSYSSDLEYPLSANYTVLSASASGAPVYILVSEYLIEYREVTKIVDSNNTSISFSPINTGINMCNVYKTEEISGGERITITLQDIIN